MFLRKIKVEQPKEPPSPQPSPAGRERGQVAADGKVILGRMAVGKVFTV